MLSLGLSGSVALICGLYGAKVFMIWTGTTEREREQTEIILGRILALHYARPICLTPIQHYTCNSHLPHAILKPFYYRFL